MNEIENILRRAPQPKAPGPLQQQLRAQALNRPCLAAQPPRSTRSSGSWLARWWPTLAPATVSLACAAGLTLQHQRIERLKADLQAARQPAPTTLPAPRNADANPPPAPGTEPGAEQEELARLNREAAALGQEVSKLEQMRAQNDKLRAQLASQSGGTFTPEETEALAQARERAGRIACVNNLKQVLLAVRLWSLDNSNLTPPSVQCLSNEMTSFKILVCPADTGRQAAKDPGSFTPANCSYEYLAPAAPENESDRVMFRCPIHGNVGLCDGSVQSSVGKEHPDWIVQRDGKYYFHPVDTAAGSNGPAPGGSNQNQ